jgi:hypothetical protein
VLCIVIDAIFHALVKSAIESAIKSRTLGGDGGIKGLLITNVVLDDLLMLAALGMFAFFMLNTRDFINQQRIR